MAEEKPTQDSNTSQASNEKDTKTNSKPTTQKKRTTTAKPSTAKTKTTATKETVAKQPARKPKAISEKKPVVNASAPKENQIKDQATASKVTQATASKTTQTTTSKTVQATASKTVHNENVSNMFGTISKHYDLLNHVLSFGIDYWWRHQLINSIIPGPKTKVLDMAAGTLDVSLAILRKYPQVNVVAGDICEPMLKYGEKKIRATEKDRITCQVMDVQEIPYANESFDAVTIAFGIRNVEDRSKALKEMNRVLVSGGQLCILEFSPLVIPYMGKAYHWYLENIIPKIAKLFREKEDAYQYLAKTIKDFPEPQSFCDEIKGAGFNFIRHKSLTFGVANLYVAIKT